jgi:hypothetical protein
MLKMAAVAQVVTLAGILAMTARVQAEQVHVTQKAREYYNAGMTFLQEKPEPRYEEAYLAFRRAYAESPSWKVLGPLGIAALHLERDQEALEALERYLKEGGDDVPPDIRLQTERDIATLKASLVRVTITIDPDGGTEVVDERMPAKGTPIVNRYSNLRGTMNLGIHPGRHRISLLTPQGGHGPETWDFDAPPGAALSHDFRYGTAPSTTSAAPGPSPVGVNPSTGDSRLEAASPGNGTPALVYVGVAVTGALLTGAGITGFLALKKNQEFQESTGSVGNELKKSGQQLALVTDVLFGAALFASAGTTYPRRASLYIRPSVGPESGWLTASGRF